MGTTAQKLQYLNTTKGKIKDVINKTNANIDNQTTFRNYAQALYNGYINVLKDRDTLLDNMNIGTSTGSISDGANLPIYEDKMSKASTQSNLPSGYTQVDYIQSSGTQYIDTNLLYYNGTREFDLKTQSTISTSSILISQQADYNSSCLRIYDNYWSVGDVASSQLNLQATELLECKYIYTDDGTNPQSVVVQYNNDELTFTRTSRFNPTLTNTLYLFKSNLAIGLSNAKAKLYYLKIYDNNVLVRDFIPCYRNSDNELGLYDLVNNVFYTNQGTGTFTYGTKAPTPESPIEVNTVKGYRNYYDSSKLNHLAFATYSGSTLLLSSNNYIGYAFPCNEGEVYSISRLATTNSRFRVMFSSEEPNDEVTIFGGTGNISTYDNASKIENIVVPSGAKYMNIYLSNANETIPPIMINKGTTTLPYVPYGTNWIYTTISDGTNSKIITIPLNDNEVCGIGDYKDEVVIDKYGHAKLVKKIGKVEFKDLTFRKATNSSQFIIDTFKNTYNSAIISSSNNNGMCTHFIMSTSAGLANGKMTVDSGGRLICVMDNMATIDAFNTFKNTENPLFYYQLGTPTEIDLGTVDMELYEGTNNITNSEDMDMEIKYIKNVYE